MKKLCLLFACLCGMSVDAATTNTNTVAFAMINVAPEQYKNKSVVYTEVYQAFHTSIPAFMQSSGFKEDKWFILQIGGPRLPVMLKKTEANNSLLAMLKPGSRVKVTGRVREFRKEARRAIMPDYYVEASSVALESGPDPMAGFMQQPQQQPQGRQRARPLNRPMGPPTL